MSTTLEAYEYPYYQLLMTLSASICYAFHFIRWYCRSIRIAAFPLMIKIVYVATRRERKQLVYIMSMCNQKNLMLSHLTIMIVPQIHNITFLQCFICPMLTCSTDIIHHSMLNVTLLELFISMCVTSYVCCRLVL